MKVAKATRVRHTTNFTPTYNMGPTNYIAAIREVDDDPSWSKYDDEEGNGLID
jgi:putative SOS response-associated peptidase YedK